jgi:hypothetical protein
MCGELSKNRLGRQSEKLYGFLALKEIILYK